MARRVKSTMPKPPSPRERVKSSAEMLARDLTEAHPRVQRLRRSYERRLRSAMGGVVRGLGSRR